MGGLTAAYELSKAGFDCRILEANYRAGGRNYTARQGDFIEQEGMPRQICLFDEGQYLNTGPGRIPYHHQALLEYCRDFSVELQVYVMENRAALFQNPDAFAGKSVANRRVANDTRGYISEMLAKVVNKGSLDKEMTTDDKQKMLSLLKEFGMLNDEYRYKYSPQYQGNWRSGYLVEPGVETHGVPEPELKFQELLQSEFWNHRFYQPEDYEWQATMFQPVGGMDQVVKAFLKKVGSLVTYNTQVTKVQNTSDGVTVVTKNTRTGEQQTLHGDYCVSNIPLPILNKILDNSPDNGFSPNYKTAVGSVPFADTCKVGWQADRRFWESPKDRIYGGITWTNQTITQIWYPSADFFATKGVLTGCYNFSERAKAFGELGLKKRLAVAMKEATNVHPEFPKNVPIDLGLSIAWQKVPHQLGGWADWSTSSEANYDRLLRPDKNFFITGDQVSYLPGWQEGAILSAHHVTRQISHHTAGINLAAKRAPITRLPKSPHHRGRTP